MFLPRQIFGLPPLQRRVIFENFKEYNTRFVFTIDFLKDFLQFPKRQGNFLQKNS